MTFIGILFVGGFIGWIAGMLIYENVHNGMVGNLLAGIVGAWLGTNILGELGPVTGGFYLLPAFTGALFLTFIVSLILIKTNKW